MKLPSEKIGPFTQGRIRIVTPEGDSPSHFMIEGHAHEPDHQGSMPHRIAFPRAALGIGDDNALQTIPVSLMFDQVHHNFFARYEAWSPLLQDMPVCIGNGSIANALSLATGQRHAHVCKGPALCRLQLANGLNCSIQVRMPVRVSSVALELTSSSMNTYAALTGSLAQLKAQFGGLRQLKLRLSIWEKSTRASLYRRFGCASVQIDSDFAPELSGYEPDVRNDQFGKALQDAWAEAFVPDLSSMLLEPALDLGIPVHAVSLVPRLPARREEISGAALFEAPLQQALQRAWF